MPKVALRTSSSLALSVQVYRFCSPYPLGHHSWGLSRESEGQSLGVTVTVVSDEFMVIFLVKEMLPG